MEEYKHIAKRTQETREHTLEGRNRPNKLLRTIGVGIVGAAFLAGLFAIHYNMEKKRKHSPFINKYSQQIFPESAADLTRNDMPIDPRGFLSVENYNRSWEEYNKRTISE